MSDSKVSIIPPIAIPGGEIEILPGEQEVWGRCLAVFANGLQCQIVAASSRRVIAILPACEDSSAVVQLEFENGETRSTMITLGKLLADDVHMVANPAIDPSDNALVLTRSGSRGQNIEHSLLRIETDGFVDDLPAEVLNPTGLAFAKGSLYVTNRADGLLLRIDRGEDVTTVASELGVATGLAVGPDGAFYVGDRTGTVYRVEEDGIPEAFAAIEGSVAAFHLAFGPDGRLYLTSPGFSSNDAVYAIDRDGNVEHFVKGFGRPQGLAFDRDGNLYVAAFRKGRRGIFRVSPNGDEVEHFVAGGNVVGLCLTRLGEMVIAASDSVYSVNTGIYGTLLD